MILLGFWIAYILSSSCWFVALMGKLILSFKNVLRTVGRRKAHYCDCSDPCVLVKRNQGCGQEKSGYDDQGITASGPMFWGHEEQTLLRSVSWKRQLLSLKMRAKHCWSWGTELNSWQWHFLSGTCLAFSKVSMTERPAPLCQQIPRPWIERQSSGEKVRKKNAGVLSSVLVNA